MKRTRCSRLFTTIPWTFATTGETMVTHGSQNVQPPTPALADRVILKRRMQQWAMIALILLFAVPVAAQAPGSLQTAQQQSHEGIQVTQIQTVAVCGQTCNCGTTSQVSKAEGPCTVNSTAGSCTTGSGECCVCAAPYTTAVCDEEMCNCGDAVMITRVPAPCMVTSTNGQCQAGSGSCCVCGSD
jgi:hypothetical protein